MELAKKILKIVSLFLLIVVVLATIVSGIAINYLFTPKKVTPTVCEVVSQYVKSDVEIGAIDITLFSTFPNLTVEIDSLRIPQLNDSIADLLFAPKCVVSLNPVAFLDNKIIVNRLSLKHPSVNLYVDSLNSPLKLFNLPSDSVEVDTATQFNFNDYSFDIKAIVLDSASIVIDDKIKRFYSSFDGFSIGMKSKIDTTAIYIGAEMGWRDITLSSRGKSLASNTAMRVQSELTYKRDLLELLIENTKLKVNEITLDADGVLKADTVNKILGVDLHASLATPSISEFVDIIPSMFIDSKESLKTTGSVHLDMNIKGGYNQTTMPDITANLKIDKGTAKYQSREVTIDNIDCDADLYINLNKPFRSYANINNFNINAAQIIDLSVNGKVTNIINNPTADIELCSDIDFNRLTEVIPLKEGLEISGYNKSDLHLLCRMSDIQNGDYGRLYLNGNSNFNDVKLAIDGQKFMQDSLATGHLYVEMDYGNLLFGDNVRADASRTLLATIDFTGLGIQDRTGQFAKVRNLKLTAGANFDSQTAKVNGVGMKAKVQDVNLGVVELIDVDVKTSDLYLTIVPKSETRNTKIVASVTSETISASETQNKTDLTVSNVNMNITLTKDDKWIYDGKVGFQDFSMFSNLFPIDVKIPRTSVLVENGKTTLNGARILLGSSDLVATGYVKNLLKSLFTDPKTYMEGELAMWSRKLDVTEIIEATNKSILLSDTTLVSSVSVDSLAGEEDVETSMLLVPKNIKLGVDIDAKEVIVEKNVIKNLVGRATILDGVLRLDQVSLEVLGAKALSCIVYKNIDMQRSRVGMIFDLEGVDVNKIGGIMPSIDSMMPMITSLEGSVDFNLKAFSDLDSELTFDMNTLRAALSFKGKDMVLMDSESFAELSKTLMFKNKERNVIDSLGLYVLADKSKVEVLPFEVTMDRYVAIIGGEQTIDMKGEEFNLDYNYNISILKSPLPFKAGVDVYGNIDDFDFKVTKAKLKGTNFLEMYDKYKMFYYSLGSLEPKGSWYALQKMTPPPTRGDHRASDVPLKSADEPQDDNGRDLPSPDSVVVE